MPSTKSGQQLPKARHGATCVHVEGVPRNVFGLKIPGNDDTLLVAKRRTRKWSSCHKLNAAARRLTLQKQASVWQCCEEHHFGNHIPANNQLAHHLPGHCPFIGDISSPQEKSAPKKPTRPQRERVSGIQQLYEPKLEPTNRNWEGQDEEEEEPGRKSPEPLAFDTRPLKQLIQSEPPQNDPLIETMGFTGEEIKLLAKASKKMSPFSAKNIHKPWLARHCKMLGKDKVTAVLRETINTMKNPSPGSRAAKRK